MLVVKPQESPEPLAAARARREVGERVPNPVRVDLHLERPRGPRWVTTSSAGGRTKRKREHRPSISGHEDHKYRAAYLAAEKLSAMRSLFRVGTSFSPEGPEWKWYLALELAIESRPRHERGHYRAAASRRESGPRQRFRPPLPIPALRRCGGVGVSPSLAAKSDTAVSPELEMTGESP
jgi:hypothetical protein